MESKKSPLRVKPRRVAGQSVQEELDKMRDDGIEMGLFAVIAIVLLLLELWRWFWKTKPSPIGAAVVCIPLFFYSVYRLAGLRSRIKNLKQGRDGERIVGEKLENLRAFGYRVFHDLIGENFNVDHIVVGPTGIFAVETKTFSKAKNESLETDGELIWKNGVELRPNPIDQAKAQARWLHRLIKELTNQKVFVQRVIVFPGWWVKCKVPDPQTLVLNPDQLEGYLKSLPTRLDEKDIGFIANRLELLVREK